VRFALAGDNLLERIGIGRGVVPWPLTMRRWLRDAGFAAARTRGLASPEVVITARKPA